MLHLRTSMNKSRSWDWDSGDTIPNYDLSSTSFVGCPPSPLAGSARKFPGQQDARSAHGDQKWWNQPESGRGPPAFALNFFRIGVCVPRFPKSAEPEREEPSRSRPQAEIVSACRASGVLPFGRVLFYHPTYERRESNESKTTCLPTCY